MNTLTKLALVTVLLTTAIAARAEWVTGYYRSSGTYVAPYYRTPANGSVYDNLCYRGYPSQQPGYLSPHRYGSTQMTPYTLSETSTRYGNMTYHDYRGSYGDSLAGTTMRSRKNTHTGLYGW